jgi:hypothetical protein
MPLSQPTRCRSTPIAAPVLPFVVRVGPEGAMSCMLIA